LRYCEGKIRTRGNSALPGVKVSVVGHPELGQTLSRADGMFDLVVNGGGQLTLRYEKYNFIGVQRASSRRGAITRGCPRS
jgi:hypothetical protein